MGKNLYEQGYPILEAEIVHVEEPGFHPESYIRLNLPGECYVNLTRGLAAGFSNDLYKLYLTLQREKDRQRIEKRVREELREEIRKELEEEIRKDMLGKIRLQLIA